MFAIAAQDRLWILSGDISNTKSDIVSNTGKGFAYSYLLVPEHTNRTEMLRRWLSRLDAFDDITVLVSHDIADIRASGMREYSN
jgi:beta-lactamase superfamily II metal-dependent hydrolase